MSIYSPPVQDMQFLLCDVLGFNHDEIDDETLGAILEEASKLASDVLAPINWDGDQHGATLKNGEVTTAPGFKDAYAQYRDGGWNAVPFTPDFGGQGLPYGVAFPVQEMWQGANMSFGLCPLLNQGAVEAILIHGSQEQKDTYLEKLISGEWTGTMNLTEPQAGSDLGLLRAKAEKQEDGSYKISGQKIYITYGEHDMADNIIHLVLARTTDAPDDVKGISLFIVPKILDDGTRNDVICTGLEHKLGIHASPTCTMQFGDDGGAIGYLIGDEHQGLKCMFTMMNNARLSVGLQGVAIAERAYQHALAYANDRVQGKSFTSGERVSIAEHADVKRMLLSMKTQIEAGRALTYEAALALDAAHDGDGEAKARAQAKVDILTPIVKSWCTDMSVTVTSIGVQIHGGMGFVEETGAAQYYRDSRILPIYEGTNGIQAADLAFRKTLRDGGVSVKAYIEELKGSVSADDAEILAPYFEELDEATTFILEAGGNKNFDLVAAAAMPYLNGFGVIAGAVMMARIAQAAQNHKDENFKAEKIKHATFYMGNILPQAIAHLSAVENSADVL
jgi:alkylation response protein AidB-like acyl-CoA dehydrogenase